MNKRYKRESCCRCTSNHIEGSAATSFLRRSDEQAFVLLPRHPESFYTQICQRYTLVCRNKPKCQISRLQLYVQDCTAPSGNQNCSWFTAISTAINLLLQEEPGEPSPAMLEKTDPAWKCCSHPSQGKAPHTQSQSLCQHQGPGSSKVKPDDSQETDPQQMREGLSQAYPNTPTQQPSSGATIRAANSDFTASLAILAVFQVMVALKSSV